MLKDRAPLRIPSAPSHRLPARVGRRRSAGAASLHAVAGGGGHVALLVKANDKRLKVDVKASDQGLVDTVAASWAGRIGLFARLCCALNRCIMRVVQKMNGHTGILLPSPWRQ